jgi:hypothetical protein
MAGGLHDEISSSVERVVIRHSDSKSRSRVRDVARTLQAAPSEQ